MRALILITLILTSFHFSTAETTPNPQWFACTRFSNCIKVTGNICNRAAAVHKKYQSAYLDYVEDLQSSDACDPISEKQINEDLTKRPTCRDGKCILIIPKDKK